MINITIRPSDERQAKIMKGIIAEKFPTKSAEDIYTILQDYDDAYLSAREYFAYYFIMTTKSVIDYINKENMGRVWQFITDAVFDQGINTLYQFYDERAKKYRYILRRFKNCTGITISTTSNKDKHVKMLRAYRNNHTAHFGDNFYKPETGATYDLPIILLERLRRARVDFNKNSLDITDLTYDQLARYFSSRISPTVGVLGANLNIKEIEKELIKYLTDVIARAFPE